MIFKYSASSTCENSKFPTANQVEALLKEGVQGFLMLLCMKKESKSKLRELPVVSEFPKVFAENIPGLPSPKEVEFVKNIIPRTRPISIASYHMSPLKLSRVEGPVRITPRKTTC